MKAAVYHGPGDVRIEEIPLPPEPRTGEVVLRMLMGSVCGTDASQFKRPTMIPLFSQHPVSRHCGPLVLGHELVGIVAKKGEGVDLDLGQRVVPTAAWSCGECPQCRAGKTNLCQDYYVFGLHAHGGFREFATFSAAMCVPVPPSCPTEAAALAQPCAIALHAIRRAGIQDGQTVALFGVGGIGSLILALLQAQHEVSVIAVDLDLARLRIAKRLGAMQVSARLHDPIAALGRLTHGRGCQIVFDATGEPEAIKQALAAVCRGGRLVQVGIPTSPVALPLDTLVTQEREIIGSNGLCTDDLHQALDLLGTTDLATRIGYQVVDLDHLVEHALKPLANHHGGKKYLVRLAPSGDGQAGEPPQKTEVSTRLA